MKYIIYSLLLLAAMSATHIVSAQPVKKPPVMDTAWVKDYTPFRIAGNLYYVGTYDLACYLVTTPKGHILINTGTAESMPMIRAHIGKLGFRVQDVKILLATHAHYDHVGAMADMQHATGAKLMIDAQDAPVMEDGGNSDFIYGGKGSMFDPVKPARLLHDKDTIALGGMKIVMLHTPGHTKGASSFLFDVKDEHRTYRVLIANMPSVLDETDLAGMPSYPNVGKDYTYTFDVLRQQQFDLWFASHASQFDLHRKHHEGDAYDPQLFADRKGYDTKLAALYEAYVKKRDGK